ncbi:hypothetical protein RUE5091_03833 [Ruegeria denitrificans]|uniref:DUF2946 domain-containing protein n=1 Tax=Ruegeria denitrificans TaxID=1715692 RepID=A0A0P1III9_9RHOB|nr:DUF2946 family protein [Ruegeria denitrificans]CUK15061.1 hypothetical protein RUE5091_03833 [Ruegeria denitrificans]
MNLPVRFFTLLTTLALLLTGVFPQGWMPAMGNDGKVLLVLCTSDGMVEQWVDLEPRGPMHDDTDNRPLCPFVGLTADVDLPTIESIIPFTASIQPRWVHRDFTHRNAGFYARYDARAPPFFF